MSQTLLEKHETLVVEMGKVCLDNMQSELGKKYKDSSHAINPGLSDDQYFELRTKYDIPNNEFYDLYSEFQKMKPGEHLQQLMEAFAASGGSVDVEPVYDEETQRLNVSVHFVIKDRSLDRIEGLSPVEENILKMNAMLQVDTALSGSDPNTSPAF